MVYIFKTSCILSCNKIIVPLLLFLTELNESESSVELVMKSSSDLPASTFYHLCLLRGQLFQLLEVSSKRIYSVSSQDILVLLLRTMEVKDLSFWFPQTHRCAQGPHPTWTRISHSFHSPFHKYEKRYTFIFMGQLWFYFHSVLIFSISINTIHSQGALGWSLLSVDVALFWADWIVLLLLSLSFWTGQVH